MKNYVTYIPTIYRVLSRKFRFFLGGGGGGGGGRGGGALNIKYGPHGFAVEGACGREVCLILDGAQRFLQMVHMYTETHFLLK